MWSLGHSRPLFLVNPMLKLLDLNTSGEALVKTDGEIQLASGQFAFSDKARTAKLRAFIEAARPGASGWSYRRSCGKFIVVHVERLPSGAADPDGPLVALAFNPPNPDDRYVWADFAPYFDLTRSEAVITRRLTGGQTPSTVAAELGVSIETVRTHIRRIYNKLGISSREELFATIAAFRIG